MRPHRIHERLGRLEGVIMGPPGKAEAEAEFRAAFDGLWDGYDVDESRLAGAMDRLNGPGAWDRFARDCRLVYGPQGGEGDAP